MPNGGQLVYGLYRWLWTGIDWLYPPHCGGCQNQGARWCLDRQKTDRSAISQAYLSVLRCSSEFESCFVITARQFRHTFERSGPGQFIKDLYAKPFIVSKYKRNIGGGGIWTQSYGLHVEDLTGK